MKKDKNAVVARLREKLKPENRIFVRKNLAISDQVEACLKEKNWTQKDLARALKKNESEISKWLSGLHNLTLQSISKLEAILETDIILTPMEASEKYKRIEYIALKVYAKINSTEVENQADYLETQELIFENIQSLAL